MLSLTQPVKFTLVGGAATLIHMGTGISLISLGSPPLAANIWAFCTAFLISFIGHFYFSFKGHGKPMRLAFPRFLAVALLGFGANEFLLFLLVKSDFLPPAVGLFLSTASVAIMTFFLSRAWAFAHKK